MATYLLQLADGDDLVVEAHVAGRRTSGEVVLESTDPHGDWQEDAHYPAGDVTAVFRRGPLDGGGYGWIPQPSTGAWWRY